MITARLRASAAWFTIAASVLLIVAVTGCGDVSKTSAEQDTVSVASTTTTETATTTTETATTSQAPFLDAAPTSRAQSTRVQTGADRLVASNFAAIAGKRVGLISHQNSVVDGRHLADHLAASSDVVLVALFGPEHGARGDRDAGEYVEDTTDPATGVPVFSLFGETRQPTPEMLEGIDVLLYDLQDVGARYYTYVSTMGLAMQAAASADISFVVLDRPNPLGGRVGGGVLDEDATSFVGLYPVPATYGLTAGELALAALANNWLPGLESLQLSVIEMVGWDASMEWPDTGLDWIAPSPALTSALSALAYPTTVYLEATTLSYGRGTNRPFSLFGAPWMNAQRVADDLNARDLPGLRFTSTTATPQMLNEMTVEPAFLNVEIAAVEVDIVDHSAVGPAQAAVHILSVVTSEAKLAGIELFDRPEWLDQLSGSSRLREDLERGSSADKIISRQDAEMVALSKELEKHHLYAR